MTFNIRHDNPADGEDAWSNRRAKVASMIRFHGADVVGLQEALRSQIADLEAALPTFGWFGTGRSAERDGEHCAVLFRPHDDQDRADADEGLGARLPQGLGGEARHHHGQPQVVQPEVPRGEAGVRAPGQDQVDDPGDRERRPPQQQEVGVHGEEGEVLGDGRHVAGRLRTRTGRPARPRPRTHGRS